MLLRLEKLRHELGTDGLLGYRLGALPLSPGQRLRLGFQGRKFCVQCGRAVRRLFGDGFCYPCVTSLARCDSCIVRPHTCHFHLGTCRDPDWGQANCFVPHVTYLALTSGIKVGVTGAHRRLERWGDQGATRAVAILAAPDRRTAGLAEEALAHHLPDRTRWQSLLTGKTEPADLAAVRVQALSLLPESLRPLGLPAEAVQALRYPVRRYLAKATSLVLDKRPELESELLGIRGQYLLFAEGGLNVRRHAGYEVELELAPAGES